MVEKERGSSELYEGKVVLQVAPGVVLLQVRALGKGREHKKGENKTGDGIAFLFRDRSGTVVVHGSLEPPIGQGLICSQEAKCIALLYDARRFQKCIWEP